MMLALPQRRLTRVLTILAFFLALAVLSHIFYAPIDPKAIQSKITSGTPFSSSRPKHDPKRLHILVPATSTNHHLCQLLTSAAILGYPAPVLINWGGAEDADDYVQHLAKVEGVLDYVEALPEEQQDELVFMMDGFDAWFQLPPSLMIKRYYDVVDYAQQHNAKLYGHAALSKYNIKDTVLFGPDKLCWPGDGRRAACWAVPNSWMDERSFGPDTDHGITEHNRARWLNSGTIMGPAREIRDVFAATLQKIHDHHTTDSDQFYFANVWADQSYARRLVQLEYDRARGLNITDAEAFLHPPSPPVEEGQPPPEDEKEIPELSDDKRSEYFIGLDFSSDIWQTIAFYEDYMTWVQHNLSNRYVSSSAKSINPAHYFKLPSDLAGLSPLTALARTGDSSSIWASLPEALKSWTTLPLATNTVTKTVAPVLHFTGKKGYRELWWPRNWFWPYQKELLALLRQRGVASDGKFREPLAGAWTYREKTMGWIKWEDGLCQQYEERLRRKYA
ncbi:uncharacterized protein HMPREF1541_11132 [Cyphellophora europaea CBS 101466]|uniref:Uncharacterized protein n=1 Tax=Cyphellophora europaea (strain CBS 101466) TaxID=1220924 RepID=W2S6Y5_CYPE1|nr:uncharacterized protein HMPREF1541_11132 [Cyphellophora europaea CBS 101466]ETN43808.1 hypothetical protein HMPREF1541_11132 [Cyphellophora europaea CBS 101466]